MNKILIVLILIVGLQSCTKEQYINNVMPIVVTEAPTSNENFETRGAPVLNENGDGVILTDGEIDTEELITDPNNDPDFRRKRKFNN